MALDLPAPVEGPQQATDGLGTFTEKRITSALLAGEAASPLRADPADKSVQDIDGTADSLWEEGPPTVQGRKPAPMPAGGGLRGAGRAHVSIAPSRLPMPPPADIARLHPRPAGQGTRRILLVICYNRPQYLQRTLGKVLEYFPRDEAHQPVVVVSQDGNVESVTEAAQRWRTSLTSQHPRAEFVHWHHPQTHEPGDDGYTKLARHFGWALSKAFAPALAPAVASVAPADDGGLGADWVTILEDDLEIAPDFFSYFRAMEDVILKDDTIMAASAYNDIGQGRFVADPGVVQRSDFFPGLGWMLGKATWKELGPKWPRGYWDDWLREPPQRQGRAFVRPEVSRTRTFGENGVSMGQFYRQFLANIRLNEKPIDWEREDVSYLRKDAFDAAQRQLVASAIAMSPQQAKEISCDGVGQAAPAVYKVGYNGVGPGGDGYVRVTAPFHFLSDVKAMVPRTAYDGVVRIRFNGCRLLFVPHTMMR